MATGATCTYCSADYWLDVSKTGGLKDEVLSLLRAFCWTDLTQGMLAQSNCSCKCYPTNVTLLLITELWTNLWLWCHNIGQPANYLVVCGWCPPYHTWFVVTQVSPPPLPPPLSPSSSPCLIPPSSPSPPFPSSSSISRQQRVCVFAVSYNCTMHTYLQSLYGSQRDAHHKTVIESSYSQAMGVFANVIMDWLSRWLQQLQSSFLPPVPSQELCLQMEQTKT